MLLSMTPLCYGTTDILNLITDGSLWNNYKEKIGQQPQWFHACSLCLFSTILSSPSTLKNNVNYQPDHAGGDWEGDWGNDSMSHLAPQGQVSAGGVPTACKAGWWQCSAHCQRGTEQHLRLPGCSGRAIHTLNNGFAEHRLFLWAYRPELKKWNLSIGSYTCLISFYDIHFWPLWNSLPSMNPLIKLPVALILMLPHSRENFVWLSRDYFNVFHVKLVGTF